MEPESIEYRRIIITLRYFWQPPLNFSGPAHKKSFVVKLKLGEGVEEYIASGPSIKKAHHAAAAIALEKTGLQHPPPKPKTTKIRK